MRTRDHGCKEPSIQQVLYKWKLLLTDPCNSFFLNISCVRDGA